MRVPATFVPNLVRCPSCLLEFSNRPPHEFEPTGIEYLDRYLEICGPAKRGRFDYGINEAYEAYTMRHRLVKTYAWAIPSPEALDAIAKRGPIVEIGAGGGYWAMLLREQGVDVKAYDSRPHTNYWVEQGWGEVKRGGPEMAARVSPRRALMLCWPPYDHDFAATCLSFYRGGTVIYIGEGYGGATADDTFHHKLAKEWRMVETVVLPQWPAIHDYLEIYERG